MWVVLIILNFILVPEISAYCVLVFPLKSKAKHLTDSVVVIKLMLSQKVLLFVVVSFSIFLQAEPWSGNSLMCISIRTFTVHILYKSFKVIC